MDIKISYDQSEKTGLDALSGLAETTSCKPCEDPNIVPIYPVRIAFADIYGESTGVKYPTAMSELQSGNDLDSKNGYTLRMLREGYVYIYDGLNDVWSIFVYSPNGSLSGRPESFAKLHWVENADGDWITTDERALESVYVPNSADEIWITYSEHRWSQAVFEKAQANRAGFRDSVMTKLNVLEPTSSVFSDNLDSLGGCVEDYTEDGIVHSLEEWNILSDLSIKSHCADDLLESSSVTKANSPGILVALHDPVGVVKEMTMAHTNKTLAKNQYLESITYPLTTAKAVDSFIQLSEKKLAEGGLSRTERSMYEEWQESVKPEYKKMIEEAEKNAKGYDETLTSILETWRSFYQMGDANPNNTPGSLQTHSRTFDPNSKLAREVKDLISCASATICSLSSSQLGQKYVRNTIVAESEWAKPGNIVHQAIAVASQSMAAFNEVAKEVRLDASAASNLMTDLAMPFAFEIEELKRIDLLKEVNQFQNGIINKTTTKVEVSIDDALHEILHGRSRNSNSQRTYVVQKGYRVNSNQVRTGLYKFDAEIHVAETKGYNDIKHKVGAASAAGFALFANALNIASLSQPEERDQQQGRWGRLANNKTALFLASFEMMGKIADIPSNYALDPIGRRYFVRGQLNRTQIKRLLKGTEITDDFIKTVTRDGRLSKVPVQTSSAGSRLLKTVVRLGNIAGVLLSFMDLFKSYEAYKRGDTAATISYAALGLGAITIVVSTGVAAISTLWGVVIGVLLLLLGMALMYFMDDAVTRWLKNGFWGTTDEYLFWNEYDRDYIMEKAEVTDRIEAQIKASHSNIPRFDISSYFEREMQEYYEFAYWPQKERPPAEIKGIRKTSWFGGTSTKTASPVKSAGVRFRLPGFVDGISELRTRIYARVAIEFQNSGVAGNFVFMDSEKRSRQRWHSRFSNGYIGVDVTESFKKNLRVVNEAGGVLESRVSVTLLNNLDNYTPNDVYWDIEGVAIMKDWQYAVNSSIEVPIYYGDYLEEDKAWEVEGRGGNKIIWIR